MEFLFKSQRLGFRKFKKSDLSTFIQMNRDKEVMEFFAELTSEENSIKVAENVNKEIDEKGHGFFAVEVLATGEFIGFIGLHEPNYKTEFTPFVEIGWRLIKSAWGQGYATEGAIANLRYGFNNLGINEIVSFTTTNNKRSEHVMKKIGMKHQGFFNHPMVPEGQLLEKHTLYKITKAEFKL